MTERSVIQITVYQDFGVYAYDVRGDEPRMILGVDVQPGESLEDAVDAVLQQVRVTVLTALTR